MKLRPPTHMYLPRSGGDWLEHWTEGTSRIDYSKPHLKIIKGPLMGHLIGFGGFSYLPFIEKKLQNWEIQKNGPYGVRLKFKDSVRTDLQELNKSGLYC